MKRFAVVPATGGVVQNVVIGESLAIVSAVVGECVEETEATGVAGIGYTWDGSVFTAPPEPEPEPDPEA